MKRLFVALTAVFSLVPDACKDKDQTVTDAATTVVTTKTASDAGTVDIMQCGACQLAAPSAWTLWAALAAPPSRTSRSVKRRISTGASREMRAGLP